MKLSELYWQRITPLHFILWPLSIAYECCLTLKKLGYWLDIFSAVKLPVPVVVVDNLSLTDDNKPLLLAWVVNTLLQYGYTPGIITRGYSDYAGPPQAISNTIAMPAIDSKTRLLAQYCGELCPVWIADDRTRAAHALLNAHPGCDVIISTDGLTYYRLERDIEMVVVDFNTQSFGNGLVLPAGPLRMSLRQLAKSAIVITSGQFDHTTWMQQKRIYNMKLITGMAYNLRNPAIRQSVSSFKNQNIHAVADDSHATWFLDLIDRAGLQARLHDYREHHIFNASEIEFPGVDAVLMPEENALQCQSFAHDKLWAIPRQAWINDELQTTLIDALQKLSPSNHT